MSSLQHQKKIRIMTSFNGTQQFNQSLTMNRVAEVHPNQGYFIQTLGASDYQYNMQPIQNEACGCLNRTSYPQLRNQQGPHSWNVSYQDQPKDSMCPYVTNMSEEPGDVGLTSFCATQE